MCVGVGVRMRGQGGIAAHIWSYIGIYVDVIIYDPLWTFMIMHDAWSYVIIQDQL